MGKKDVRFWVIPTKICIKLQQKFGQKYFVALYASDTYPVGLRFLGLLQHPFLEPFPKFLNCKNHKNTYKHTEKLLAILWKHWE